MTPKLRHGSFYGMKAPIPASAPSSVSLRAALEASREKIKNLEKNLEISWTFGNMRDKRCNELEDMLKSNNTNNESEGTSAIGATFS